jgi:hypothetical protein
VGVHLSVFLNFESASSGVLPTAIHDGGSTQKPAASMSDPEGPSSESRQKSIRFMLPEWMSVAHTIASHRPPE